MKFKIQKIAFIILFGCKIAFGQTLNLDEAIQTALKNNPMIQSAEYQIEYARQLKQTSTDIGKLSAVWMHGQYNSINTDNNITLVQSIPFPTTLISSVRLGKEQVTGAERGLAVTQNDLVFDVKTTYDHLLYLAAIRSLLLSQDSLYADFVKASSLRYKTGESNLLEKTTAEVQWSEVKNLLHQNLADITISQTHLQSIIKSETPVQTVGALTKKVAPLPETSSIAANPQLRYWSQQAVISGQAKRVEQHRLMPDLLVGYFSQSLTGVQNINGQDVYFNKSKQFQGVQLGIAFPLWFAPHLARAKAAAAHEEVVKKNTEHFQVMLNSTYNQALQELDKNLASLLYYESSALQNANLILTQSGKAYRQGEISYVEYLQAIKSAIVIKNNYLLALTQYNQSVIKVEYLLGKF